ncbi:MAG: hypothetical protein RIG68_09450 [Imperialibacter sp.]
MGFFYDEDERKSYQSIQDWYSDIRHLLWPAIISASLVSALYACAKYFY